MVGESFFLVLNVQILINVLCVAMLLCFCSDVTCFVLIRISFVCFCRFVALAASCGCVSVSCGCMFGACLARYFVLIARQSKPQGSDDEPDIANGMQRRRLGKESVDTPRELEKNSPQPRSRLFSPPPGSLVVNADGLF